MSRPDPTQIKALYAQAMQHQAANRPEQALRLYARIIDADPRIPEAHFQIARIHAAAGRYARALPHLATAATLKPSEPAIWQTWAEAAALSADHQAGADLLAALRAAPAPLRIALQDRFAPYRPRPMPGLTPALRPVVERIASLSSAGNHAGAERLAAAELARHPQAAGLANLLGIARLRQGRREAALEAFQRAATLDRFYAEALNNLGQVLLELGRAAPAAAALRAAVVAAPNWPAALANLADALHRQGADAVALPYAERAVALDPKSVPALVGLGKVLIGAGQPDRAADALARAAGADPARPELQALLAQAMVRLGRDDAALTHLDRALALAPAQPLALAAKAELLQGLGRFDEAEAVFRHLFEVDPATGEHYRMFIASHRTQADDPILPRMIARFDDPATRDVDRMNLGFAIAKALEDTKQYDQVFRYLNAANGLMRKARPYDIAQRGAEIAALKAALAGFDFHAARTPGASDYAPIFVTGMPRSGTTLVEQIISSHSSVSGAGEVGIAAGAVLQALRASDGGLRSPAEVPPGDFARIGADYAAQMRARFPGTPRVTDKSILSYQYLGLIRLTLPKARFIVVRRDPRDTLLSIYKNKFAEGAHLYAYSLRDLGLYYRSFVEMVVFWAERVPDWFHIVDYEELVANPEAESRKLIAACGLEWEDRCLDFHKNTRKVDTLSVYQVRQPITGASVKSWQRYETEIAAMVEALGDALPEVAHGPV